MNATLGCCRRVDGNVFELHVPRGDEEIFELRPQDGGFPLRFLRQGMLHLQLLG